MSLTKKVWHDNPGVKANISDAAATLTSTPPSNHTESLPLHQLEQELAHTKQLLQNTLVELHNARDELRAANVVYKMTEVFSRTTELDIIYKAAIDGLMSALNVDRISILVMDEAQVMRFRAWHGISPAYRQAAEGHSPWPPNHPDPQPVLVPDVREDKELDALQSLFQTEGIRALGFIPLQIQGQLIGKFMLYYNPIPSPT